MFEILITLDVSPEGGPPEHVVYLAGDEGWLSAEAVARGKKPARYDSFTAAAEMRWYLNRRGWECLQIRRVK
jgi:hypothetical protein